MIAFPRQNGGGKADANGGYRSGGGGRGGHSETSSLYSRYTPTSSCPREKLSWLKVVLANFCRNSVKKPVSNEVVLGIATLRAVGFLPGGGGEGSEPNFTWG